ncbi:MAG: hypothetical protein HYZ51_00070 [Candidatus Doudnabacteria bacterium]|nr:hypothetical protein [Candidatus Doudnabacteria bacterium]
MKTKSKDVLRILIAAPSLDILGGQSRQAAVLLNWFKQEPGLEVSFVPHNPRLPGPLRFLQKIKYVRTVVTSLWYWGLLLIHIRHCDVTALQRRLHSARIRFGAASLSQRAIDCGGRGN